MEALQKLEPNECRQDIYRNEIRRLCDVHNDIKIATKHFVKHLEPSEKVRLEKLADETKFERRRYGKASFFCWPLHSVFTNIGIDPWPASRYPKSVLIADFAVRT